MKKPKIVECIVRRRLDSEGVRKRFEIILNVLRLPPGGFFDETGKTEWYEARTATYELRKMLLGH